MTSDEDRLAELLIQWEEILESGRDVSASELCHDCPHLIEQLSQRIKALKGTAWMDKPVGNSDDGGNVSSTPTPDDPPRTLANRYRLDQRIAEGGFAQVWRGYDLELLRNVAIKMPKVSAVGAVDSFMAEARRVARLKHPGIVPVHDVGRETDSCFIVSELVEGGSLGSRLNEPIDYEQATRWIAEVCEALHYAHIHGIVHRDIKPANILIDHHGRALLADFGIALSANKTGQFAPSLGTLAYMSPEQLEGKPVDPRSDIYSIGVLLCQLLTGKLPYDAHDQNSLRKEIVSGAIHLTSQIASPEVRTICLRCLAHDPQERYQSAEDVADDLRALGRPSIDVGRIRRRRQLIAGMLVVVAIGLLISPLKQHLVPKREVNLQSDTPRKVSSTSTGQVKTNSQKQVNQEAMLALGKLQFDKKEYEAAINTFTEVINRDDACSEAYHRRAACFVNLGKPDKSLSDFDRAVQLAANDPAIRRNRSIAYSHLGRYDEALGDIAAAQSFGPADPASYNDLAARIYSWRAKRHADAKRWEQAARDVTESIRLSPASAIYYRERGAMYFNLKQFDSALADMTAAIERNPNDGSYFVIRSHCFRALGRGQEAQADLEKAKLLTNSSATEKPSSEKPTATLTFPESAK